MGSFSDRVAIVTGATGGIGRETAMLLATRGAKVVLTGRNRVKLEATAADIKRKLIDPEDEEEDCDGEECGSSPACCLLPIMPLDRDRDNSRASILPYSEHFLYKSLAAVSDRWLPSPHLFTPILRFGIPFFRK